MVGFLPQTVGAQSVIAEQATTATSLNASDEELLKFMVEEEKLAHDVYVFLYQEWGNSVFSRIAQSELTHMTALRNLLSQYVIEDPSKSLPAGLFENDTLQELYTTLTEQGSLSLVDALAVVAAIEELDIADLRKYVTETENTTIQRTLNRLLAGSYNHLRAFSQNYLRSNGTAYEPVTLSKADYDAIVGTNAGNGRKGGRNR
jgi:hypothetical protein